MKTEDNGGFAPPTHAPRPQSPSWRSFAETIVVSGVISTVTLFITDAIFESDSFFVRWAIFASLYTFFNFLYQKVVRAT